MKSGDCKRRTLAAVCGRYCGACDAYQDDVCCGCGYQLGQTRRGECALFQCCIAERGLEHCGLCPDFPCQVFVSHAPPLDVAQRYRALRRRAEIGTAAWLDEVEGSPAKHASLSTTPGAGSPPEHPRRGGAGSPVEGG